MHQNATVAQSIVASLLRFEGRATEDRAAGSRLSDESLSLRRLPPLRRGHRLSCRRTTPIRAPIDRFVDAIDEHTALVPISLVLFRSALPAGRAAGRREGASRRRARRARRLSGGRHGAVNLDGARRRLRGRRLGEVAVRRTGRRVSLRAPGSRQRAAAVGRRLGGPRLAVRVRDRRRFATPTASSASRAARRTCRRSIPPARATRSSPRLACPRFARSRCALTRRLMDAAARARLAAEHADRPIANRGGIGRHRRAGRRARHRRAPPPPTSSSTTGRTPAFASRRISTTPRPRSITPWTRSTPAWASDDASRYDRSDRSPFSAPARWGMASPTRPRPSGYQTRLFDVVRVAARQGARARSTASSRRPSSSARRRGRRRRGHGAAD